MVDYTKPEMRDETWRRWKGGQKLADDLRAFYTNQRVFKRLAFQNPMAPTPGNPVAQEFKNKKMRLRERIELRDVNSNRTRALRRAAQLAQKPAPAATPAVRQSGATLP